MDSEDISSYPPNSHKSKDKPADPAVPEKKIEKIITGEAKLKKPGAIKKALGFFMPEDVDDFKSYIIFDVLIPKIKSFLDESFHACLYGKNSNSKNKTPSEGLSYRAYYDSKNSSVTRSSNASRNDGFEYDDIILDNRGAAEDVLVKMKDLIEIYGAVSIGDLYELVGLSSPNYTNRNYGWKSLKTADVLKVRDGYLLKLPKAIPLQ